MKHNWKYLSIGECFPSIKNGANIKQIAGANGYPITRIETLSGGVFNRDRMGYANIVDLTKYQDYILESGDLLLSHINSKAYIGRTVKYEKQGDEKIIHGMNLLRLRANPEVISSSLFAYYSKSMKFKDAVARIRKDAVNQSSMAISDLKKIIVPVPPLEEQSRIVAELDLLTGIIDKQNAQLKELDNLAQAIFYDMFGDPIENPKRWEVQLLKQHTTKIGSGATPKGGNESYKSEGIPLIRSLNVYNGTFKYKDLAHIDENQAAALDNVILQGGDVLLNITGASVARCCIVPCDLVSGRVNQHVAILRPKDNLKSVFLCAQLISSGYQQKLLHDSKANGATREALTKSQLEGLPIILPPLTLQQSFAEKIQSIEKQKETIRASIADTQKLLDYTMDKYFG